MAGQLPEPDDYEVADDPPPAAPAPAVPASVLPYRAPKREAVVSADLYFPSNVRDVYVPCALLLAGMGLGIAELHDARHGLRQAIAFGTAYSAVKIAMMLVCIPLVTRVAGVSFGTLPQGALKLATIAILPDALALGVILLVSICTGMILAPIVGFVACWVLFGQLFELDFTESRFCAAVYCAIDIVFGVFWFALLDWMLDRIW